MTEDLAAFVSTALTTQTIAGCSCGMSADAVRAVLGEPAASERQGKLRVWSFESGLLIYFQAGKVVTVLRDLDPPIELERVERTLEPLSPTVKPLAPAGTLAVRVIKAGRISLEVLGQRVVSIHLASG